MAYLIDPVAKVQRVPEKIACNVSGLSSSQNKPKATESVFKKPDLAGDVFIKRQNQASKPPKTFGDMFIKAIQETVKEIKDQGKPVSAVSSRKISTSIVAKIEGYKAANKINHVI